MAEVWLARQPGIEGFDASSVVVKRILPHLAEDREFVEMFLNEAQIAARFNHPNIAQIYDFGEANGTYFIAMEYIHGEDLGRRDAQGAERRPVDRPAAGASASSPARARACTTRTAARTTSGQPLQRGPPRHLAAEHPDQLRRRR